MDVQAAAGTAVAASTTTATVPRVDFPPLPPLPGVDPDVATTTSSTPSAPSAGQPVGSTSSKNVMSGSLSAASNNPDTTLQPVVAKLFNAAAADVQVSFQISKNPDEIITVFTDKSTGKEIVQFPSETLVALAQFFNKLAGNVLDKKV